MSIVKRKEIKPQEGGQERFVRSNVDVCIFGGILNCGKSSGSVLSVAEYLRIPEFKALFLRRNLDDQKRGGGLVEEFRAFYTNFVNITTSESPRATASTGAWVDFTHIADENPKKVIERFKGAQYDYIYFDELTSFDFSTFTYLMTRNRGKAGIGGKFRATTNPKKSHWLRTFLDWYIDPDGFIYDERDGKVRYFFVSGQDVQSVVWGNTKEEVYNLCKVDIDRKLKELNKNKKGLIFTYQNLIKSFVFYKGNMAENIASLGNNMDYAGSVAASGGAMSQQLIEGNWNIDENENPDDIPLPTNVANNVFMNDPQTNNDWFITTDLAAEGSDNLVAIVWNGFHVKDILIIETSTPVQNAQHIVVLAEKWNVPLSQVIFDGTNGMYLKDYITEARPFKSRNSAIGLYKATYMYMKNECAYRLIEMIRNNGISFDDKVANKRYVHKKLHGETTIRNEFVQECYVLRFREDKGGRKALFGKKEMNQMLGHGRSMDLLDCFIMRMRPILRLPIGSELTEYIDDVKTTQQYMQHGTPFQKHDIYSELQYL
jgi:hypothetical protein